VLLRLTRDMFALVVYNNTSTDTERRAGLSAIAELLVTLILHGEKPKICPNLHSFWAPIHASPFTNQGKFGVQE